MSSPLLADIDFDVCCHFGNAHNVDVSNRGVYYVKATLLFGKLPKKQKVSTVSSDSTRNMLKIAPVGMFSAPTSIDSLVKLQRIPAAPIIEMAQVNDNDRSFHTRTFVIRYKGEIHELNDGVNWRLTVPSVDLSELHDVGPACLDLLHINFKLMCIPLINDNTVDMMKNVDKLIPDDLTDYKIMAEETLSIQRGSSGYHELFPIRFDRFNFLNIDCMVHVAVTGIRYCSISIGDFDKHVAAYINGSRTEDRASTDKHSNENSSYDKYHNIHNNKGCDGDEDGQEVDTTVTTDTATTEDTRNDDADASASITSADGVEDEEEYDQFNTDSDIKSSNSSGSNNSSSHTSNRKVRYVPRIDRASTKIASSPASAGSGNSSASLNDTGNKLNMVDKVIKSMRRHSNITVSSTASVQRIAAPLAPSRIAHDVDPCSNNDEDEEDMSGKLPFALGTLGKSLTATTAVSGIGADDIDVRVLNVSVSSSADQLKQILRRFLRSYSSPLLANFNTLVAATEAVFKIYLTQKEESECVLQSNINNESICILQDEDSLLNELLAHIDSRGGTGSAKTAADEVYATVKEKLDLCNVQACRRWSLLLSALPRIMPLLKESMSIQYRERIRLFWKRQLIVHTCCNYHRVSNNIRPHPRDDYNLAILEEHIRSEVSLLSRLESSGQLTLHAHGLPLFNYYTHYNMLKLPVIAIQQYMPPMGISNSVAGGMEQLIRGGVIDGVDDVEYMEPADSIDLSMHPLLHDARHSSTSSGGSSSGGNMDDDDDDESTFNQASHPKVGANRESISMQGRRVTQGVASDGISSSTSSSTSSASLRDKENHVHLIVLHHGFQGNSYDMHLLANYITVEFPDKVTHVLCARSNEKNNEDSTSSMGRRLSQEIITYCTQHCPALLHTPNYGRVSFIGHSLGGLVIRKVLEEKSLTKLIPKLHAYVSLASPHVGALHAESRLVSAGMWAMFQFKKSPGLREVMMEDCTRGDLRSTSIYKLSKNQVLQHFKHVLFISSPTDAYVPSYSARVQSSAATNNNAVVSEMISNILDGLDGSQLVRITIANNVGDTVDVNSIIGRTSHLCYLDNMTVAQQLVHTLTPYFK